MSVTLKTVDSRGDLAGVMGDIGRRARVAARKLALAATSDKDAALNAMADAIRAAAPAILSANVEDVAEARSRGATSAFIDRLALNDERVAAMAEGIAVVAGLEDPVGALIDAWDRPNG
ncbi:MAG: gamma-glutamyl-phosphate reductase, partial [Rhodoplanes sp.]